MELDAMKGGVEGTATTMEMQRLMQTEQNMNPQEQNRLARSAPREDAVATQTGVAVQGLGESVDVMV